MDTHNISVGLDIGTTKIAALVGRKNDLGKLEILGLGYSPSEGVQRGMVTHLTKTTDAIIKAVKEAEIQSGYKIEQVNVGIAGQHIRSLQHTDYIQRDNPEELITREDIQRLMVTARNVAVAPGEEIIHIIPQEFKVDDIQNIADPVGMLGKRLEANFHIVVGQMANIKTIARCVKDAGLELAGITLEPLASSASTISQEELEAGVVLIDIGGGTTDVAIFKNEVIKHTAVIPFGGRVLTEDIKEGCGILDRQAEQLKVKFGSAWPGENKESEIVSIPGLRGQDPREVSVKSLSKIIHARMIEILSLVRSNMDIYAQNNPQKKLNGGVILTGGGSQLKHLKQLTEYVTGLPTRLGYPTEHLAPGSDAKLGLPHFATGIGLVIKGFELDLNPAKPLHKPETFQAPAPIAVVEIPQPEPVVEIQPEPVAELQPEPAPMAPAEPVHTPRAHEEASSESDAKSKNPFKDFSKRLMELLTNDHDQ